ncbi:MAG: hypothetical protein A9183_07195 [Dehalococcoides mccartyi]|uniref:BREX-3 system phosphatase PglZ n=1 Tax=Dehalococcoides mccartyi TaxID=61435 RepID=UPI000804B7EE|nr:BREX-3 system phosphatase PglZ [Dehalococcoides mccartyi]OBW63499.1 MAG: hypothetical protein A9183_07195 [Dehalococcoides mccartyi]
MSTWQSEILKEILHTDSKLVIVTDPDKLLFEENVQQQLNELQFDLFTFEDPVVFRYEYESRYRSKKDTGQEIKTRILLRVADKELNSLPFDVLQAGHKVSLDLGNIFPKLSYPVLEKLPVEYLDKLYQAYHDLKPSGFGDNETCDFILRYIFQITADTIKDPEDLLKTLIRIHFKNKDIPSVLVERLLSLLKSQATFKAWPLKTLLYERDTFFKFLQERWPIFIDSIVSEANSTHENRKGFTTKIEGPSLLPFEHMDVRVYIDDLFMEGLLQPIKFGGSGKLPKSHRWAKIGLITGTHQEEMETLGIFLESVKDAIPSEKASFQEWLSFSAKWAHLNELRYSIPDLIGTELEKQILAYQQDMDISFTKWLQQRYASLYNMPATFPVMQHHIPRALTEKHLSQGNRIALIVLDGMSSDQWLVIKNILRQKNPKYKFDESAIFAWAPTITSVSRQALFSSRIPIDFTSSIMTTEKEQSLWLQFWLQQGLSKNASAYINVVGDIENLPSVEELCSSPQVKVIGLVVGKLDKIMHGMELGAAGMQSQVKQWIIQGFMEKLLDTLRENKFQTYITADHGNIEARGCGQPKEGLVADLKGERVRIYVDSTLRSSVTSKFPGSIEWPSIGIPETFLPLIAPNRMAFITEGHSTVTHGGVCIEELIVPFVHVDWRDK